MTHLSIQLQGIRKKINKTKKKKLKVTQDISFHFILFIFLMIFMSESFPSMCVLDTATGLCVCELQTANGKRQTANGKQQPKVSISAIVKFLHAQEIKMNEHTHEEAAPCNNNVNDQGTWWQLRQVARQLEIWRPKTPKAQLPYWQWGVKSLKTEKLNSVSGSGCLKLIILKYIIQFSKKK